MRLADADGSDEEKSPVAGLPLLDELAGDEARLHVARRGAGTLEIEVLDAAVQVALRNFGGPHAGLGETGGLAAARHDAALGRLEDAEPHAQGAGFAVGSVGGHGLILGPN